MSLRTVETAIDVRLAGLYKALPGEWLDDVARDALRAAYASGYCDALAEPERGRLCRDHGYTAPAAGSKEPLRELLRTVDESPVEAQA